MDSESNTHNLTDKRNYFNLLINVVGEAELMRWLGSHIGNQPQVVINFLNAHCFNVAQKNERYRVALNSSTFLLNDGIGVSIGAALLGFRFKENMNGTDLIPKILRVLEEQGRSVFLLGATEPVIQKARGAIRNDYPNLRIAGYHHGFFDDETALVDQINRSGAEAIIIGMGVPLQELWVQRNRGQLSNVKLLVTGGAIFDFTSGAVPRAPKLIRSCGLEWIFRLALEPRRLFGRYVIGNFQFLGKILAFKLRASRANTENTG